MPRQNCSRIMTVASLELLPRREPGGGTDEAGQHGDEGRASCGGERALQDEQPGEQIDDHRRVRGVDGLSSQTRYARAVCRTVTRDDRLRLERIVSDGCAPQKHVWRAQIIFATAEGCGTSEIMRRWGKSKPVVWRWQERFMQEGVDGLLRDKTRPPGKKPLPASHVQRVVDLALSRPPGETTHWTGRMLAEAAGVSVRSVQRILEAHQLAPHRIRTFKLSKDPKFADKLKDIVGLYVDPPVHAVVLSVDEKSQIQALDRTQPGLPMKKGAPAQAVSACRSR